MTTATNPRPSHPYQYAPVMPRSPKFETWVPARAEALVDERFAANAWERAHVRRDFARHFAFEQARKEWYARLDVTAEMLHDELINEWVNQSNLVRNRMLRERGMMQVCLDFRWLSATTPEYRAAFDAEVDEALDAKLMADAWYLDHIAQLQALNAAAIAIPA